MMRARHAALGLVSLLSWGCATVSGADPSDFAGSGGDDLKMGAGGDSSTENDLATTNGADLVSFGSDAATSGADGSVVVDQAMASDLSSLPDLSNGGAPDLGPSFNPAHVNPSYFTMGSADLVVASAIDTGALTIDGAAPPGGTVFVADNGLAVLAVGSFTVGNSTVKVSGSRPLVIVAARTAAIHGTLDAAAHGGVPGPGGSGPSSGAGRGPDGLHGNGDNADSGGGGGGYGGLGGSTGGANGCTVDVNGVMGGGTYNDAALSQLLGGSGGGAGSIGGIGCPMGVALTGGAGGGAVQISAAQSITIDGKVALGGGGGSAGCWNPNQTDSASGAGGGSGGALLLESPSLVLAGATISANGGAGGGGAYYTAAGPGSDALLSVAPAPGGAAGNDNNGEVVAQRGANGATSGNAPGTPMVGNCGNSGGGGGGAGRMFFHSRGAANLNGATITPTATASNNL